MKTSTIIRLIVLSMIWGASFLFLRIATPEFRPLALILVRVAVGALCLAPVFLREESRATFRKYGWKIIVVGILNSAIPFSLLAYSTLSLEAGFTSLLNASTPIFAAVAGALWFGMRLGGSQVVGLCVALLGVVVLSWDRLEFKDGGDGWAVLAALLASSCYGLAANLSRRWLAGVNVRVVSAGCMAASAVVLFPLGVLYWPSVAPSGAAWACALGLATACTAVAYLLYFRLLEDAGAVAASSVTFLVPIFGVLWGVWLLQERLDGRLLLGMVVTLLGAALTLKVIRLGFRTKRGDASESSKSVVGIWTRESVRWAHFKSIRLETSWLAAILYFVDRNTAPPTVCAHFKLMAEFEDRFDDNTTGRFYVDDQCIDCDLCRETAPDNFTRNDDGGYSFVYKQPENEEEGRLAREAMEGCPVEAIGDDGPVQTVSEGAGDAGGNASIEAG